MSDLFPDTASWLFNSFSEKKSSLFFHSIYFWRGKMIWKWRRKDFLALRDRTLCLVLSTTSPIVFHLSSFIYRWFFRNINPRNPEKLPLLFAYKTIQKVLTKSFGDPDALMRENQNEQKLMRVRSFVSLKCSIFDSSETSSRCSRHGRIAVPSRSASASASTPASSYHVLGPTAPSHHPLFAQFNT